MTRKYPLLPALALGLALLVPATVIAETPEPPFFQIDGGIKGPLTMEELQVTLPREVADMLTKNEQACFYENVETMIAAAGDPNAPNADAIPNEYTAVMEDWDALQPRARRAILAQIIMGVAMSQC